MARKLMDFLTMRFPNAQFIVICTVLVVPSCGGARNLAVLRRSGDHVLIDNDVDNIRGWRITRYSPATYSA